MQTVKLERPPTLIKPVAWWLWHVSYRDTAGFVRTGDSAALLEQLQSALSSDRRGFGTGLVATGLGLVGARAAVPELGVLVSSRHRQGVVRDCAADALLRVGGPEAAVALAPFVQDESYTVRSKAIKLIGAENPYRFAPELETAARSDPKAVLRGLAAEALGRIQDDEWIPFLVNVACDDPRLGAALGAQRGLREMQSANALAALDDLAESSGTWLRRRAAGNEARRLRQYLQSASSV